MFVRGRGGNLHLEEHKEFCVKRSRQSIPGRKTLRAAKVKKEVELNYVSLSLCLRIKQNVSPGRSLCALHIQPLSGLG
jgi:hypothetical protein